MFTLPSGVQTLTYQAHMLKLKLVTKLSRDERKLIRDAYAQLLLVRIGLHVLPTSFTAKLMRKQAKAQRRASLYFVFKCFEVAASYLPNASSMTKVIAAQRLLASYGYRSEVHLAESVENARHVHAWLIYRGHALVGAVPKRFEAKKFYEG